MIVLTCLASMPIVLDCSEQEFVKRMRVQFAADAADPDGASSFGGNNLLNADILATIFEDKIAAVPASVRDDDTLWITCSFEAATASANDGECLRDFAHGGMEDIVEAIEASWVN